MKTYSELREAGLQSLQGKWTEIAVSFIPFIIALGVLMLAPIRLELLDPELDSIKFLLWSGINAIFIPLLAFLVLVPLGFASYVTIFHKYRGSEEKAIHLLGQSFKHDYGFSIGFSILYAIFQSLYLIVYYIAIIILVVVWFVSLGLDEDTILYLAEDPAFLANFIDSSAIIYVVLFSVFTLLFMVAIIQLELKYMMVYFIRAEHPKVQIWSAMKHSKAIMKGHKRHLFVLCLTFIGWALLAAITCGLALFFVYPYMIATFAAFYDEIRHEKEIEIEQDYILVEEE